MKAAKMCWLLIAYLLHTDAVRSQAHPAGQLGPQINEMPDSLKIITTDPNRIILTDPRVSCNDFEENFTGELRTTVLIRKKDIDSCLSLINQGKEINWPLDIDTRFQVVMFKNCQSELLCGSNTQLLSYRGKVYEFSDRVLNKMILANYGK